MTWIFILDDRHPKETTMPDAAGCPKSAQLPTAPTNQPPGRLRKKKPEAQAAGAMAHRGTPMDLLDLSV